MDHDDEETPDPGKLPEDPTRTAGEAAGVGPEENDEGRTPPPEDLDEDPAYSFDEPESELKGG